MNRNNPNAYMQPRCFTLSPLNPDLPCGWGTRNKNRVGQRVRDKMYKLTLWRCDVPLDHWILEDQVLLFPPVKSVRAVHQQQYTTDLIVFKHIWYFHSHPWAFCTRRSFITLLSFFTLKIK